jgi:hypothetical protein
MISSVHFCISWVTAACYYTKFKKTFGMKTIVWFYECHKHFISPLCRMAEFQFSNHLFQAARNISECHSL